MGDDPCQLPSRGERTTRREAAWFNSSALHKEFPYLASGVYRIDPDGKGGKSPFKVYCDMKTDGGGWTYAIIVSTETSSDSRSRIVGVSVFGSAGLPTLGTEYGADLTGIPFTQVRIDNITAGSSVVHVLPSEQTWDSETYIGSDTGSEAKRVALGDGWELRMGYYGIDAYCGDSVNIPVCERDVRT